MQTGGGLRDLFPWPADRVEPGRLVPAEFAKSSFREIFPTNRESAKPPPGLIFAKSSFCKIPIFGEIS